jgi:F-type H+-transporting ATPase subunit c
MRKLLLSAATLVLAGFQPALSMAAEAAGAASADAATRGAVAIGAGLAIGVAAFGAALGQGRVGASAMESIGRNPNAADKIFLPLILGLAFIEALALYGFVIAFLLQGKI